ncbi:hypothetical protein EQU24_07855 [Methylotuvimicrobium buryatense]|uniref:Uncharacterized protein n=1 Tax=Methylotuvimicrobium buryatense TaxID=95641 RepID=A0A4P9ULT6_METBY|nr:hypothetical protein EQU24_07855 [Methylotuvimicrobium buryatense]
MALAKALPAWSWHRAYMDVFTASFDGHPGAEFRSTMSILRVLCAKRFARIKRPSRMRSGILRLMILDNPVNFAFRTQN